MQSNQEHTKEFNASELTTKKTTTKNSSKKSSAKKKTSSKKGKGTKRFKPIYLVPIIFVLIAGLVLFAVIKISSNDGPVYGERCAGMTDISNTAITTAVDGVKQEDSNVTDVKISVNCKTIKIDMTMAEGSDKKAAKNAATEVLSMLDEAVGLSKSNSDSKYSDLLGILNGKTQYHVDFVIKGGAEGYPIFASKHPSSDKINFTYNEARDPDLVEKLHEQQAEDTEE